MPGARNGPLQGALSAELKFKDPIQLERPFGTRATPSQVYFPRLQH